MASNDPAASIPSASPNTSNQSDNVSVRVIALAYETHQNEDVYLVLGLDTSVSQLKEQLQQNLSHRPQPDSQRLIYQGRPLTDGNMTLRQILRLDPSNTSNPPAHVLHLVIRESQNPGPPAPSSTQPVQPQNVPSVLGLPTQSTSPPQPLAPPDLNFVQQAFPQGHPAQAMLQNALQQHMAIHNQHHNQHQNQHQNQFHGHQQNHDQRLSNGLQGSIPAMNVPPFLPQLPRIQPGQVPNPHTVAEHNAVSPTQHGITMPHTSDMNNAPSSSPSNIIRSGMTMRIHETIGPNGERTRRVVQSGPLMPGQMNTVERSASAPGGPPRSQTPNPRGPTHPNPGPMPMAMPQMALPIPPMLPQFHTHPPSHVHQTFGRLPNMPPINPAMNLAQQGRDPVAYLVSSPTGPEALLFAPNHGIFSSQQQSPLATQQGSQAQAQAASQLQGQTTGTSTRPTQPMPTPTQPAQPARNVVRNNDQVALRPLAPPQGQVQGQPVRREGEDLVALVLQRGWLFLRLYMFIFVLSEPGTWRRYILLTIASLVCLLPRNNPFTDILQAARRHFDNLIGPPQAPARLDRQQAQDQHGTRHEHNNPDNGSTQNGTYQRTTDQMPTPEQHARRLLRDREERHPNIIRDAIYRVEQAAALFFASLIPGVGERHVRAREEARRVVQEEEQRRRHEAEEIAAQQSNRIEDKPADATAASSSVTPTGPDTDIGTSTGVSTSSSNTVNTSNNSEGLRLRGGDS